MLSPLYHLALATLALPTTATPLQSYNANPASVSVSGFSSGGFMAAQLGIAYSDTFKLGFGVFAGGPYDCARNQPNKTCMFNNTPSITTPTSNLLAFSAEGKIDPVDNLKSRRVFMQVGELDVTTGPAVLSQLKAQLEEEGGGLTRPEETTYILTENATHTFPTDFDAPLNSVCSGKSASPYISNCGYDGAGAVLRWLYGSLEARRSLSLGGLTGAIVDFDQVDEFGALGMGRTGYVYVPGACVNGETVCRLHVVLHGCLQSPEYIGTGFVEGTGYNSWADANNIIVLYPQTTIDNTLRTIWDGERHGNPYACWDWIGLYGEDIDWKGGVQMAAIVNMVRRITAGYSGPEGEGRGVYNQRILGKSEL
ncbi:Alpha/Beta hydrolase protein [Aspergillus lucknowensis]|uniref:Alpha/Beta hydrolase protein n=1 Tax=Aspergillus lucknowensis TaxID=176173 RepID=A0ABR4LFF5_9EURO